MNRIIQAVSVLGLSVLFSGCSHTLLYSVSAANYGEHGIILKHFPTKLDGLVNIRPGIPGVRADIYQKGPFKHYPNTLPDKVEVIWQLAETKDCKRVIPSKTHIKGDDDPHIYISKVSCTFVPIPGKLFRKTIDLTKLLDTPVGQRAGRRTGPWWTLDNSRYGLSIDFEFREDQLTIDTYNYRTNPWR